MYLPRLLAAIALNGTAAVGPPTIVLGEPPIYRRHGIEVIDECLVLLALLLVEQIARAKDLGPRSRVVADDRIAAPSEGLRYARSAREPIQNGLGPHFFDHLQDVREQFQLGASVFDALCVGIPFVIHKAW